MRAAGVHGERVRLWRGEGGCKARVRFIHTAAYMYPSQCIVALGSERRDDSRSDSHGRFLSHSLRHERVSVSLGICLLLPSKTKQWMLELETWRATEKPNNLVLSEIILCMTLTRENSWKFFLEMNECLSTFASYSYLQSASKQCTQVENAAPPPKNMILFLAALSSVSRGFLEEENVTSEKRSFVVQAVTFPRFYMERDFSTKNY